ncbi:ESX secretion-associated protein EspG [Amycolatopsis samaneae]|uniref:ESX secretion-associated protein EspG n=1 Tax=Amycolatopsis samaneae TaxID=664691 RepID=A0ABW5G769_9PSEU
MATSFEFSMSGLAIRLVGFALGVEVRRDPLSVPDLAPGPNARDRAAREVAAQLRRSRLLARGRVNPYLQVAFELFRSCRASVALTGIDHDERQFGVLGLSDFRQALVVWQGHDTEDTRFTLLPDEDWIEAVTAAAPSARAAAGRELVMEVPVTPAMSAHSRRRLDRAERDEQETREFDDLSVQSMIRPPQRGFSGRVRSDRELVEAVMAGERLGSGRLSVTARRRTGPRTSAPDVGWFDTGHGRYLLHTTRSRAAMTITVRPGGTREMGEEVRAAIGALST